MSSVVAQPGQQHCERGVHHHERVMPRSRASAAMRSPTSPGISGSTRAPRCDSTAGRRGRSAGRSSTSGRPCAAACASSRAGGRSPTRHRQRTRRTSCCQIAKSANCTGKGSRTVYRPGCVRCRGDDVSHQRQHRLTVDTDVGDHRQALAPAGGVPVLDSPDPSRPSLLRRTSASGIRRWYRPPLLPEEPNR